ncbi:hypothetical protein GCM10018962_11060 [Dactylosporangium matsuzakiense]|uniref:Uncharacterized protein n=1 Tax=Dactylosporangium matsuzakiense TaxID=53360 RepID=A0A9W6NJD0_9ACTN|nr:hypothetical protein GCM10017581_008540 [Dactylosporangium matsuzakiense]
MAAAFAVAGAESVPPAAASVFTAVVFAAVVFAAVVFAAPADASVAVPSMLAAPAASRLLRLGRDGRALRTGVLRAVADWPDAMAPASVGPASAVVTWPPSTFVVSAVVTSEAPSGAVSAALVEAPVSSVVVLGSALSETGASAGAAAESFSSAVGVAAAPVPFGPLAWVPEGAVGS